MNDDARTDERSMSDDVGNGGGVGSGLARLLLIGLAVGAAVVAVRQLPDIRRYLKMRSL